MSIKVNNPKIYIDDQEIVGIKSVEVSFKEHKDEAEKRPVYSPYSIEGRAEISESNIRIMSPTLRRYFKSVRMMGKLYI